MGTRLPQLSITFVWGNWQPNMAWCCMASNPSYSQGQSLERTAELKSNLGSIVKLCLRWKQKTKLWPLMLASPGVSQLWKPKSTTFLPSPKLFTEHPLHLGHSCEMELSFKHVAPCRRGTEQSYSESAILQWRVSWLLKPVMARVPGAGIQMHGPCRPMVTCTLDGFGGRQDS